MKPVLSKTFGKNGDVIENFAPTAKQILFALSKAQNPTLSDNEILDKLGIHRNSLYQWKTKYGHSLLSSLKR
jgi:transposase-like protein